jgi:hypothetical protein
MNRIISIILKISEIKWNIESIKYLKDNCREYLCNSFSEQIDKNIAKYNNQLEHLENMDTYSYIYLKWLEKCSDSDVNNIEELNDVEEIKEEINSANDHP